MKKLGILFLIMLCTGCNLLRKVDNQKKSVQTDTQTQTQTKRTTEEKIEGGDISSDIIPERERLLDSINGVYAEFVKTFRDGGLTKTIYYKPDGSVQVNCEQEDWYRKIIEEILQEEREEKKENESQKNTEKEFEGGINWTYISLGFMGILGVILFKKL